jgi:hypothetical protein
MLTLTQKSSRRVRAVHAPDWRFQWLTGVPELIRHNADVSKEDISDRFCRELLLPFAQRRNGHPVEMYEHEYQGLKEVFESYSNKASGGMSAFLSEGCALAGASLDWEGLMTRHQDFYEAVFFDIRIHLDNVEAIVALVFEPLCRAMPQSVQELESKVVAYGLGIDQFHRWTRGEDSEEIRALRGQLGKLEAFRVGLETLGLPYSEVWSRELTRLLRSLRAGGMPDDKPEFMNLPRWRERLERLIESVPEGPER